jgi:plasmid maintenance system antidote protein VapI
MLQKIIDNFIRYIELHGLTQGEAAELVQISRPHLNKIIHGKETPSSALLMRMEKVMGEEE